jgi:hypothetical protein
MVYDDHIILLCSCMVRLRCKLTVPQIFARGMGLAAASAHEVGCGLVKSPDRACVCRDCNRNWKRYRIYKAVLQTIEVAARNHLGQPILSIIQQILDIGLLLHERA